MQDFLSDQEVNLDFTYGSGVEPIIPDVGSVTFTVFDHSGIQIAGLVSIPITTNSTTFKSTVSIPAINNSIDPTKMFERRTVFVRYQVGGSWRGQTFPYRLIPFTNMSTGPDSVRAFLGINRNELADSDIDMFRAYMFVSTAITPEVLGAALASGTQLEIAANEAITMRAVIDIIPSLQNRVAQSETNGIMGFDRIKIKDYSELLAEAIRRYNDATNVVLEIDTFPETVLIVITTDTDPVTGA